MYLKTIVEIIPDVKKRLMYQSDLDCYAVIEYESRMQGERSFNGFYGWVDGYGAPPEKHLDVFVLTEQNHDYGEIVLAKLVGVFKRSDGDHKLICIEMNRDENEFFELNEDERQQLLRVYNKNLDGDEWLGQKDALEILNQRKVDNF